MFVKKFFKIYTVIPLIVFVLFSKITLAENLRPHRVVETVAVQPYVNQKFGPKVMLEYHRDIFLLDPFFAAFSISGIISGSQGGFGVVNFGAGYRIPVTDTIAIDIKGLWGSGGGGGVKGGGGFSAEGQLNVSFRLARPFFFTVGIGYLEFPTGYLETPTVLIGLSAASTQYSLNHDDH